jgi:hypothetical protein
VIRPWHLRRLLQAARVWRRCRYGEVAGGTFHAACVALADAVALFQGIPLDHPPRPIPTPAEVLRGQEIVRQARAYADRRRPRSGF